MDNIPLIQIEERIGGPEGFPFAISKNGQILAWAKDNRDGMSILWTLQLKEALKQSKNNNLHGYLCQFLIDL